MKVSSSKLSTPLKEVAKTTTDKRKLDTVRQSPKKMKIDEKISDGMS